jgi:hypothetical protein
MRLRRRKGGEYETADGRYSSFRSIMNTMPSWFLMTPAGMAWSSRCSHEPEPYRTLGDVREIVENPLAFSGPRVRIRPQAPRVLLDYAIRCERLLAAPERTR